LKVICKIDRDVNRKRQIRNDRIENNDLRIDFLSKVKNSRKPSLNNRNHSILLFIMTNQRQVLLQSIATIVADYRQGEIPPIDSNHVDKWVRQFDQFGFGDQDQIIILGEMQRILKSYYISRIVAKVFLARVLVSQKLFGSEPTTIIRQIKFLQIQTKGNSQNDLLNICEEIFQSVYEVKLNNCGQSPVSYIYLDDCLYSGNRVLHDIEKWISNAVTGTTLYLVFFALHTSGREYVEKKIMAQATQQRINVKFLAKYIFHNSRWKPSQFDCFWSRSTSGYQLVDQYVQAVSDRRQSLNYRTPPLFRPNDMPTQDNIFSSPSAREVIELAFLKAGAYIVSLPKSPNTSMRPLGYEYLESLGLGAIFVTYRNIANNCPLALWWGDANNTNKEHPFYHWYPLFPRIVNTTSTSDLEDF
jgi:hypothetical protein